MKLRLNFELIFFIFHVTLSEHFLNESKKWHTTEKDEKVTYKQHVTKLSSIPRFSLFSEIKKIEENLYNDDMLIFYGIPGAAKCHLQI